MRRLQIREKKSQCLLSENDGTSDKLEAVECCLDQDLVQCHHREESYARRKGLRECRMCEQEEMRKDRVFKLLSAKIKILWCMDTKFTLCRIISEYQMQQTANSRTGSRYSTLSLIAYTLWLVSHWTMHIHQSVFTIPMVMNRQYDALFGIKVNMKWILSAVQNNTYTIRMSLGRMHTSAKDEAMSHTVIIIMIYVLD